MAHVCYMLASELQPAWMWFRSRRETSIETKIPSKFALPDQSVNQQQIRLGGRYHPPTIGSHVDPDDRVSQRRQRRLGILADAVKQLDVALGTRNCETTSGGGRDARKRILAGVLLILAVDHLVARHARVDAEERIVRDTDDRLLSCCLSELAVWGNVVDGDVVVDFPLLHNLATLDVQAEKRMRSSGVLQDHLGILVV